jgi:hypothetical protein
MEASMMWNALPALALEKMQQQERQTKPQLV